MKKKLCLLLATGLVALSLAFFMQIQAEAPNNLASDMLVAIDVDIANLVSTTLSENETGIAIVYGSVGFLAPIEGDSFLIMSSGNAQPSVFPEGWVGTPTDTLSTYNNNPHGTGPLGGNAYDITTLGLTLRAPDEAKSLSFNFRFMSEEYPDYVGQQFNDFFICLLNGTNIVFDTEGNIINVNNNFFDPNITPEGTVFNATTVLLTAKAPITGGTAFELDFIVGDVGDYILDTAVFIDNFRFSTEEISGTSTIPTHLDLDEPERESRSLSIVATVGVGVAAATALLAGLGPSLNSAISNLPIPKQLRSFLKFYGASLFQKVDKVKLSALEKAPLITRGELAALGISIMIVTIVYSFVEANGLQQFLKPSVLAAVIPSTFFSVCVVTVTKVFSDAFCARTGNAYRKFSLWVTGVLTFVVSGILFLFPFSSPGITRYQSLEITKKTKGLIVLSKTLILLTLTIPFSLLFMMGFKIIGDTGVLLALMYSCYSLVPLKHLSGKAVFDYRKEVSLIAFASTAFLFYSCTVNLLHIAAYLPIGIISAVIAVITLRELKRSQ